MCTNDRRRENGMTHCTSPKVYSKVHILHQHYTDYVVLIDYSLVFRQGVLDQIYPFGVKLAVKHQFTK